MRLIDADNLNAGYGEKEIQKYGDDFDGGVLFALNYLSQNAPTVDAVTIEELEQLRDEMAKCEGGDSYLVYYGHEFRTDVGYAFDGIDMLIDCLKIKRERKGGADDGRD